MSLAYLPKKIMSLKVHQLLVGSYANFVYVLVDEATKDAVIIDPAWDVPALLNIITENSYNLKAIWLTHAHGDHVEGIPAVLAAHPDLPVWLSPNEHEKYRPAMPLHDIGDTLQLGNLTIDVIHSPGHSPGGVCFKYGDDMIAGDSLFIDGCGRCDLVGSDPNAMFNSIHTKLMTLPDSTIIYPGHNYGPAASDTLGNQKKTNRFMLATTSEAFIKERMG
ncbi:MAG: hydroxyacylglutathione hydrolase [Cellvibrionaceae bacterium]|jgi:hydroxyacylglutathione hydrolase